MNWSKLFFALTFIVLAACNGDKNEAVFEEEEAAIFQSEEEAWQAFAVIEAISHAAMRYSDADAGARIAEQSPEFNCATLNFVGNAKSGELTIDYGDGCKGPDGKTRRGIVIVEYDGNWAQQNTEVYTVLKDFYLDDMRIQGSRRLTNVSLDSKSLVFTEEIINGTITWPDHSYLTRSSDMVHTLEFGNNDSSFELLIEGSASGRSRLGVNYKTEIMEPLRVKSICRLNNIYLPVSGTKSIFVAEKPTISVNYGAGQCDNKFDVSLDEASKEVAL
ncbi:MAG: hypothetical protein HC819_17470 [Cyclobacteriaceae bacterium]|nr:hypothetical protein [Cyclobacteriaceae bacterium]